MLKRIEEKVDKMEEQLEENLGVLPIYREIIASFRKMLTISVITIIFLSILLIINIVVTIHNEKSFMEYRENSISKEELITILDNFIDNQWGFMKRFDFSKSEYEKICEECMLNEEERVILRLRCQGKSSVEILHSLEELGIPMSSATLSRKINKIDNKIKRWA